MPRTQACGTIPHVRCLLLPRLTHAQRTKKPKKCRPQAEQEQLSEDEDEVVPPKPKKKSHSQEAKPAKSLKALSAATAMKFKKSKAMVTIIVTVFQGNRLPEPQVSGQLPLVSVTSLTPTMMITQADHDEGVALPWPQPKKHKEKSAQECKADKKTIKLNKSVYETTYHNHLATIVKMHVGAKNATSILMHNVFKDVTQLRPGAGVPSTGGTLINIVKVPDSDWFRHSYFYLR
ncbi:hypothetical protein DFH08DRAFT_817324 [Mycena albidolilacea]|uniref:Uncharacterized protein n=1 Tax=Mycena albidolilacea TaxID=1033008 RepID=A0AAD7EHK9_9AGAR|nr:hypothetical protein DFH08DRAFT_817324 [Mycena albidolilacea]